LREAVEQQADIRGGGSDAGDADIGRIRGDRGAVGYRRRGQAGVVVDVGGGGRVQALGVDELLAVELLGRLPTRSLSVMAMARFALT